MTENDCKLKYAELLAEGHQPYDAAVRLFKPLGFTNPQFLMRVSTAWPKDTVVVAEKTRIEDETPSETKFKNMLLEEAKKCPDPKARVQAFRLAAEAFGIVGSGAKNGSKSLSESNLVELQEMIFGG